MPGEDVYSWSTTASENANADTAINWAEGQPRASVNNSARSEMAAIAKFRTLLGGTIVTGGTGDAQTFTSGIGYTEIPAGMRVLLSLGNTNTTAATLAMDGLAGTPIVLPNGAPLNGGELVAGQFAEFRYNGTNWVLMSSTGRQVAAKDGDYSAAHNAALQVRGNLPVLELHNPGLHFTKFGLNAGGSFTFGGGNWSPDRVTINSAGDISCGGVQASLDITGRDVFCRSVQAGDTYRLKLLESPTERLVQFEDGGWRLSWTIGVGNLTYYDNLNQMRFRSQSDGNFLVAGNGYKPGGGAWADSSDARIKTVAGNYTTGLEAINALNPVRFTFKGNDGEHTADGKEFVGLVAQDVEAIMPEMVTKKAGNIDGKPVTDIRVLDTGALIYALVNSVRELSARIEELEAR